MYFEIQETYYINLTLHSFSDYRSHGVECLCALVFGTNIASVCMVIDWSNLLVILVI
jgi:hypothetical protein